MPRASIPNIYDITTLMISPVTCMCVGFTRAAISWSSSAWKGPTCSCAVMDRIRMISHVGSKGRDKVKRFISICFKHPSTPGKIYIPRISCLFAIKWNYLTSIRSFIRVFRAVILVCWTHHISRCSCIQYANMWLWLRLGTSKWWQQGIVLFHE